MDGARGRATDVEEMKAIQQQQMLNHQQQQQQQQLLLLQQLQRQKQQDAIMSRFPSNIDAHLRPQQHLLHRSQNPNPNPQIPLSAPNHQNSNVATTNSNPAGTVPNNNNGSSPSNLNPQQQHKAGRSNPMELQMAYQDAWRVCHPDFKRPFSSLEDACERYARPRHLVSICTDVDLTRQCFHCVEFLKLSSGKVRINA